MKSAITSFSLVLLCLSMVYGQSSGNVLKVQGEAVMYDVPELMQIRIPVQTKNESYEACSNDLIKTYNALSDALVKSGVDEDEVKSDRLNIQENYTYLERERKLDGYIGNINVMVELPHTPKMLTAIMNTLKEERFKFGYTLSFAFSEPQKEKLREEAIRKAIADARRKAEVITEEMGLKLVSVQEINYGYFDSGRDIIVEHEEMAYKMSDSESTELTLNPQKMEIRKNIGVIWLIAK